VITQNIIRSIFKPVGLRSCFFTLLRFSLVLLLLGFFAAEDGAAQTANITVSSVSAYRGTQASISVAFAPGATAVSTVQFDLNFSSALSYAGVSTGQAANNAGKTTTGNSISGGARFLVFGMNQTAIGSGVIANIQLNISSGAPAGLIPVTISGIVAADPDAAQVITFGTSGSVTVLVSSDTTPPTISGVTSTNIFSTGATIAWNTNETSDTQVEYGLTTGYGNTTSLNSGLTMAHSQELTGLSGNTLYHYRVRSKDAAGNLATSGDNTFITTDAGDAPTISAITISGITNKSATISWSTNKPADSEVEYWVEQPATHTAALRTLVTSHSLTLNSLQKNTLYHFLVKSTDGDSNQAVSSEGTFTTAQDGTPSLAWPRFSSGADVLGTYTMVGLGLANLSSTSATLTFTATDSDGNATSGQNITNPVTAALDPTAQLPILDWELFGSGLLDSLSNGWGKLESTTSDTTGFYLIFDSGLSLMDGGNFAESQLTDFAFTEIQTDGYNKINIINNNPETASLTLDLMRANGTVRSSQSRVISANGALTADLFDELFAGIEPNATDYVRVHSSKGVLPFQVMRQKSGDVAALSGMDLAAGAKTLYSPQYAIGGPWRTALSIINLDSVSGSVLFQLFGENGAQIGTTRFVAIPASGKFYLDDPGFFLTTNLENVTAGYVVVTSDNIRIAGSTVFGDIHRQESFSALALISDLQNSVLFSHVASNDLYYHGIAIVNPGSTDTVVTLQLYAEDGTLLGRTDEMIGAKQRQCRVLAEYFSTLEGMSRTSGYVRLHSGSPIASFSLFGTKDYSVLSAIPPQVIQ
jgi:hypothetical protein